MSTRDVAGAKAIEPLDCRKTEKVGEAPALSFSDTILLGGARQALVAGFVSHSAIESGRRVEPVSADTLIDPALPRFTVATANAAAPFSGISTMPSAVGVAASAMMSGIGVEEMS